MSLEIVSNNERVIKKVFFLGAGFSAYAGIPTFNNFRNRVQNIYDTMSDEDANKTLFRKFLNGWSQEFDEYNIEEYYSIIEMYTSIGRNNMISIDDVMTIVRITIEKSLENTNTDTYKVYKNFLKWIKSPMAIPITTNWDLLPEILFEDNVRYHCIEPYNKSDSSTKDNDIFTILKLHGSLNWGFCEKCEKIYYLTKDNYKDLTSEKGIKCNKHVDIRLKNFVVPPTLIKSSQNIEDILRTAFDYMAGCEELYFIGYSFPETDVPMKILVSAALNINPRLKKIYIISSMKHGNEKIYFEERYRSVIPKKIPNSKICFYYKGFDGFYNDLQKNVEDVKREKDPLYFNLIRDTSFIC